MQSTVRQTAVADDADLPDDLFASIPDSPLGAPVIAATEAIAGELDLLATLPALPSLLGLADRLAAIQTQLDEARVEAEALRQELRAKSEMLRAMAGALEAI